MHMTAKGKLRLPVRRPFSSDSISNHAQLSPGPSVTTFNFSETTLSCTLMDLQREHKPYSCIILRLSEPTNFVQPPITSLLARARTIFLWKRAGSLQATKTPLQKPMPRSFYLLTKAFHVRFGSITTARTLFVWKV